MESHGTDADTTTSRSRGADPLDQRQPTSGLLPAQRVRRAVCQRSGRGAMVQRAAVAERPLGAGLARTLLQGVAGVVRNVAGGREQIPARPRSRALLVRVIEGTPRFRSPRSTSLQGCASTVLPVAQEMAICLSAPPTGSRPSTTEPRKDWVRPLHRAHAPEHLTASPVLATLTYSLIAPGIRSSRQTS